jgi:hypothetical protein
MSNLPDRETFESMYAGKPPWDIGKPQPAFVQVADRVTGEVLDAGCGTGENALSSPKGATPSWASTSSKARSRMPGGRPRSGAWTPSSSGWTP